MRKDNLYRLLIVINLLLFVGVCIVSWQWVQLTGTLKSPCAKCEKENSIMKECFEEVKKITPYEIKINWSDYKT